MGVLVGEWMGVLVGEGMGVLVGEGIGGWMGRWVGGLVSGWVVGWMCWWVKGWVGGWADGEVDAGKEALGSDNYGATQTSEAQGSNPWRWEVRLMIPSRRGQSGGAGVNVARKWKT